MNDTNPLLDRAISLLVEGRPLPVDLTARLMEQGIDMDALEARHGA